MKVATSLRSLMLPVASLAVLGGYAAYSARTGSCPLCAILSFVGTSAQAAEQPAAGTSAASADESPLPPAFKATTLDGKAISLGDFAGKVVLIDFWATWCPPCRAEIPHVKAAYEKYHKDGFEIIGVSLDENKDTLRKFIDKEKMNWAQVVNNEFGDGKDPASLYGVRAIPTTILVGRGGSIAATDLRGERLATEIAKALKAPVPADAKESPGVTPPAQPAPFTIDLGRPRGPERAGLGVLDTPAPAWKVDTWFNLPAGKASLDLADYKGKVVYLYGFQSWCPGCHSVGFPTLQKLIEKFGKADDVAFVAVQTTFEGFGTNTADAAKKTGERYNLSIPIGHSGSEAKRSALMQAYKTGGTPWTIVIDKDGVVRYNDFHITPAQGERLISALRARPAAGAGEGGGR